MRPDPTILLDYSHASQWGGSLADGREPVPTSSHARPARGRARAIALAWLLPISALALAEIAGRLGWVTSNLLPTPSDVARALFDLGGRTVAGHVAASTARVAAGYAIGAALAMAAGSPGGLLARGEIAAAP